MSVIVSTSLADSDNVVMIAPASDGLRIYLCGYSLSYSAAIATAHQFDLTAPPLIIDRFPVPTGVFIRSVEFARTIQCPVEAGLICAIPAAGAGVVSTIVLRYFIA